MVIYSGLSIRIFEVIVILVVEFFVACSVYKISNIDTNRPPSCFIIRSILITSQAG